MGRIKMFAMGVRRRDMSAEDFHDYWRHPHGTWGRKMSTLRGYVQSHQVHTEHLGPGQAEYECVAELWLDNERDVQGFQQEPIYAKYLHDDASNFCDYSRAIYFATQEEVLTSGPAPGAALSPGDDMWSPDTRPFSIKLLHFVGVDAGPNWASPADEALGLNLRALRHVRCYPLLIGSEREPRFLGVQELWWPTLRAFRAGVAAAPSVLSKLLANGGRSVTLLAQAERFM
jgi:uncharacterized protein (TIGR02118 family)